MAHPLKRQPRVREDGTIEIVLTKGYVALIDPEDAWLAQFNWSAMVGVGQSGVYAMSRKRLLHRVILGLEHGDSRDGDHVNGDTLDCRRANLRAVSSLENSRNQKLYAGSASGYPGISLASRDRGWHTTISKKYLGTFKTLEEAVAVRLAAEREMWGIQPRRASAHDVSSE